MKDRIVQRLPHLNMFGGKTAEIGSRLPTYLLDEMILCFARAVVYIEDSQRVAILSLQSREDILRRT